MTVRQRLTNRRASETFSLECAGLAYTCTISRFPSGEIHKAGSSADTAARDSAICVSLALQFGADIEIIRKALCRDRKAAETGARAMYCSLEMTAPALAQRALTALAFKLSGGRRAIPYSDLRSGRGITDDDFSLLRDAQDYLDGLPLVIEQQPSMTLAQIAMRARRRKQKFGLDLLIIDHLHKIRPTERYRGQPTAETKRPLVTKLAKQMAGQVPTRAERTLRAELQRPANFDLGTLMAESMAATVPGAGISAAGHSCWWELRHDCRADRLGPAHRIRNTAAYGAATGNGRLAAKLVGGPRAVCAFRSVPRDDGDNT